MKLGNVVKSFAVIAAILCASHANAQNVELATNLGFEDPIGADGDLASDQWNPCLLYTSPSPRDGLLSRMPSSA